MIGIIRAGKMYLYDNMEAFYNDKDMPKNQFIHIGVFIEVHNRSSQEVIL
jgi:hypothetical protein